MPSLRLRKSVAEDSGFESVPPTEPVTPCGPPPPSPLKQAALYSSLEYFRDNLRPFLLPLVEKSSRVDVVLFQRFFGVYPPPPVEGEGAFIDEAWQDPKASIPFRIWSLFWTMVFRFGSGLGSEIFYITFFPFLVWNIDFSLARRCCVLWVLAMYVGQSVKDHLMLPRPSHVCKQVNGFRSHWEAEHGFPSTHTMAVFSMAFYTVYFTYMEDYAGHNSYPLGLAILLASGAVCLTMGGRLFLGMHSVPDLWGGLLFAGGCMGTYICFDYALEDWMVHSVGALYLPSLLSAAMLLLYPHPKEFSPAFGETAMIAGVGNGCIIASYFLRGPTVMLNWLQVPLGIWSLYAATRVLIGLVLMVITRQLFKGLVSSLLVKLTRPSPLKPSERNEIVVPTKFITYTLISLVACYVCPLAFTYLRVAQADLDKGAWPMENFFAAPAQYA